MSRTPEPWSENLPWAPNRLLDGATWKPELVFPGFEKRGLFVV